MIKYGARWKNENPLLIEFGCIRAGGRFQDPDSGKWGGNGLEFHLKEAQKLLWPDLDHHRWSDLLLHHFASNEKVTVIFGPASSGKTHCTARNCLTYWFADPKTAVLATSTTREELELRVWGEIKKLYQAAKERWGALIPGVIVDSKQQLVLSTRETVRDVRDGVICVPCLIGGGKDPTKGLSKYVGIKARRILLCGDEVQFMNAGFQYAISNLAKNREIKATLMGNPSEPDDILSKVGEPVGGYDTIVQDGKTKTWRTKFYSGTCIQLIGTDSPNYDFDQTKGAKKYPYLIGQADIEADIAYYGPDHYLVASQNLGSIPTQLGEKRVITKALCDQFHAMDTVKWGTEPITRIAGLDAAYTGEGDRNMLVILGFGRDVNDKLKIALMGEPHSISATGPYKLIEDNIADNVKRICEQEGIRPGDFFYDATGRGTLVGSFSRLWSPEINTVEFGGRATDRPAIWGKGSVVCSDKFASFVTELWFAARAAIESDQVRQMTPELVTEGCARKWELGAGHKVRVERKTDTKARFGRSPDMFDAFVCAIEGARRRGFRIDKVEGEADEIMKPEIERLRDRFKSQMTLGSRALRKIA